jgi:bacteriocin biosynthesis cyclodehydratase domain-containing protein
VLGILCGIIGTLQATEAIKILLGKGDTLSGRVLTYDSLRMKFREFKLRRDPACPVCGEKPSIKSYIDYEGFCAA